MNDFQISEADRETLKLAWSAMDAALKMPGFAGRLPLESWLQISALLGKLLTSRDAGNSNIQVEITDPSEFHCFKLTLNPKAEETGQEVHRIEIMLHARTLVDLIHKCSLAYSDWAADRSQYLIDRLVRLYAAGKPEETGYNASDAFKEARNQILRMSGMLPPETHIFPENPYRDPSFPERKCDRCEKPYRGPAVYCSLKCATEDA